MITLRPVILNTVDRQLGLQAKSSKSGLKRQQWSRSSAIYSPEVVHLPEANRKAAYRTQKIIKMKQTPIIGIFRPTMGVNLINRPLCKDLVELTQFSRNYIPFFNYERISLKIKGMTPIECRNHTLIA